MGGPPDDRDLTALVDEARADEAARERTRRRWLEQQAAGEARLSGVLLDASERGEVVTVHTTAGATHRGVVAEVGSDFCTLRCPAALTLVRLRAVGTVIPDPGSDSPLIGSRRPQLRTSFVERLGDVAAGHLPMRLSVAGVGDVIAGEIVAVGEDVATIAVNSGRFVYVSLDSVTDASFFGSG